jgi:MFS family permease
MLPRSRRPSLALAVACIIAFASLTWLSFTAPPVAEFWRLGGFFGLGLGAGALNTGILHAISSAYRLQPAATINLAGAFFGLGSAVVAILIAGVFDVYTVSSILFLVAIAPGLFAVAFAKAKYPSDVVARRRSLKDVAREFTIPSAVLFSLLLFLPVRERVGYRRVAGAVSHPAPGIEPQHCPAPAGGLLDLADVGDARWRSRSCLACSMGSCFSAPVSRACSGA